MTKVTTRLSAYNASQPSVYSRTALGRYVAKEGESITFEGFNIGTNAAKVTIPGMSETQLANGNKITLTSASASGTGARSGDIVFKVNLIEAINNKNNNNATGSYTTVTINDENIVNGTATNEIVSSYAYNRCPNGLNNNVLTDDIKLDVWEFKNAAEPVNGGAQYVTMKINPKTGIPGFSYANSVLYYNMPAYNSDRTINARPTQAYGAGNTTLAGNQYSQIPTGMNYGGFTHNSFTFDDYGYSYGAAVCIDTQDKDSSAYLQFFSRETPVGLYGNGNNKKLGTGLDMNYANAANASRLDMTTMDLSNAGTNYQTNINRTKSISMDTSYSGGTNTAPTAATPVYVYLAYFDDIAKQVRFRWGTVGAASDNIDGKTNNTNTDSFNRPTNAYGLDDIIDSKWTGYASNGVNQGNPRENVSKDGDSFVKFSNTNNSGVPVQVIAQSTVESSLTVSNNYKQNTTYSAGQYVSMNIVDKTTASPKAVVFWSDGLKLYMAYNTSPTTGHTWTSRLIDSNGGMNVKSAVDSDGGLHVAYYTTNGGNLKYAFIPSYNCADTAIKVVDVDTEGAVGTKCTIDVAKVNGKQVPYISYQYIGGINTYNPKIAYLAGGIDKTSATTISNTVVAGAINDKYTGKWEISIVPTDRLLIDDAINVGVWRDSSNGNAKVFDSSNDYKYWKAKDVLTYGGTAGSSTFQTIVNDAMDVGSPSIVYGNNTANPIVAYALEAGSIQMGQKK